MGFGGRMQWEGVGDASGELSREAGEGFPVGVDPFVVDGYAAQGDRLDTADDGAETAAVANRGKSADTDAGTDYEVEGVSHGTAGFLADTPPTPKTGRICRISR